MSEGNKENVSQYSNQPASNFLNSKRYNRIFSRKQAQCASFATVQKFHLQCQNVKDNKAQIFQYCIQQDDSESYQLTPDRCYTLKEREKVVDWMIECTMHYKSGPKVIFLAVNLMDRFLTKFNVQQKEHLQLIALACFFISAKVEDIYPPHTRQITDPGHQLLNKSNLVKMEQVILKFIKFDIIFPTVFDFLEILLSEFSGHQQLRNLTMYFLEVSLLKGEFIFKSNLKLTLGALFLACKILKIEKIFQQKILEDHFDYRTTKDIASKIYQVIKTRQSKDDDNVKKKYSSYKYGGISKFVIKSNNQLHKLTFQNIK